MTSYNHLKGEESPYLKQHVKNPVEWYPWGEEAFKKAKEKDLPIFLSIGYSTCHWCHVMEEESFTDSEIAEILNDNFVAIKVDREERPEIDKLYMEVCKAMTGGGGWPLTIFMTPDKQPFYAATYIPKRDKYGRRGLLTLLPQISKLWHNQRDKLLETAQKVINHLSTKEKKTEVTIDNEIYANAASILARIYDGEYGGFGSSPKFPMPQYLIYLLHYWNIKEKNKYLKMVNHTLKMMRSGGMYDQLGFGFHRYSTDRQWEIPHFEKMLYDQALLTYTYIDAYLATNNEFYKDVAKEVITYLKRDLLSKEGGFYAAEDADSEGEEGKFYFWSLAEIKDILTKAEFKKVQEIFEIDQEDEINLRLKKHKDYKKIPEIKKKLFKKRAKRERPGLDNKILTDWNGITIAALAKTGFVLQNEEYINLAKESLNFILTNMRRSNNLSHSYCNGKVSNKSNLDDYSYLLWGLIELHQATLENNYLKKAEEIADEMISKFWDQKEGGFYYTQKNNNELFLRQKDAADSAIPSGNSLAAFNLLRLSHLTNNYEYSNKSEKLVKVFSKNITDNPVNFIYLLLTQYYSQNPFIKINILGDKEDKLAQNLKDYLRDNYQPDLLLAYEPKEQSTQLAVCENFVCQAPTDNLQEVINQLNN